MAKATQDPDVLGRALRKTEHGYGTTATEKQAIQDYNRGKISRDHFAPQPLAPQRPNYRPLGATPNQLADRIYTLQESPAANATITELHYNSGGVTVDIDGSGIVITYGGKTLTINPTLIAHDMSIRTISVCSGGSTKSIDILASAPY